MLFVLGRCVLWLDHKNDVFVLGLMPWKDIQSEVFLRHRIDECAIFLFINTDHFPTHLKIVIRIRWIDNGKCNLGVALHSVLFLALFGLTEEKIRAIPTKPDYSVVLPLAQ